MADFYTVHESNPNDTVGGGGCLASGARPSEDCKGRWIHFFRVSTEFDASPYAVICEKHLAEVIEGYQFEDVQPAGDVLPIRETQRVLAEDDREYAKPTPHIHVG